MQAGAPQFRRHPRPSSAKGSSTLEVRRPEFLPSDTALKDYHTVHRAAPGTTVCMETAIGVDLRFLREC
jgi:hypothetical protein